jgi:hypothetical protein
VENLRASWPGLPEISTIAAMRTIFLCSVMLLTAACGGNKDALEKRVSGLQEEVTRLQNGNDRLAERLQALELSMMRSEPRAATEKPPSDDRVVRPPLKVVHMGPGSEGAVEEEAPEPTAQPEAPRPVLKDHGSSRAGRGGVGQVKLPKATPPGTLK